MNAAAGATSAALADSIAAADPLLTAFSGTLPYDVSPGSPTGRRMVRLAGDLASLNNRRSFPDCPDSDSKARSSRSPR